MQRPSPDATRARFRRAALALIVAFYAFIGALNHAQLTGAASLQRELLYLFVIIAPGTVALLFLDFAYWYKGQPRDEEKMSFWFCGLGFGGSALLWLISVALY